MLKSFYQAIIRTFFDRILKLILFFFVVLLFSFLVSQSNEFSDTEFFEALWMPKTQNMGFLALYTSLMASILLIIFQYVETINLTNIKEFVFRVNNKRKLKKSLIRSILLLVLIVVLFALLASLLFMLFLSHHKIFWLRVGMSASLYGLLFAFLGICYYWSVSRGSNKNTSYLFFLFFHFNNIFSMIPWISIPDIARNFNFLNYGIAVILFLICIASVSIAALKEDAS